MKKWSLSFVVLVLSLAAFSQDTIAKVQEEKKNELIFFSNNGCGKCETSQAFFEENHMPYTKFLVTDNRPLMYEYIHQKTKGKNVAIGYPVIIYGDSIYFSIKNIHRTLDEIKQRMMADEVLKNPEP
jgi:glutaredoxin